jgi:hypothetical protein
MTHELLVALAGLVLWCALTGALNYALRVHTAEEWVRLGEQRPRTALVIRLLRTVGVDPAKFILVVRSYLEARERAAETKIGGPS